MPSSTATMENLDDICSKLRFSLYVPPLLRRKKAGSEINPRGVCVVLRITRQVLSRAGTAYKSQGIEIWETKGHDRVYR